MQEGQGWMPFQGSHSCSKTEPDVLLPPRLVLLPALQRLSLVELVSGVAACDEDCLYLRTPAKVVTRWSCHPSFLRRESA